MKYTDKFDGLRSHIMKELGFNYREFRKYFPKFYELRREAELRDIGRCARLACFQIKNHMRKKGKND